MQAIEDAQPELAKGVAPEPFRPEWRGIDMAVGHVPNLDQEAAAALESADLGRLLRLARAPRARVERILDRYAGARQAVAQALDGHGLQTVLNAAPNHIQGWVERLLPPGSTQRGENAPRTARFTYGIDPVEGAFAESAEEAARLLKVTRQAVYAATTKCKDAWNGEPALHIVHDAVASALEGLGGAAPLSMVADALPEYLPHADRGLDADTRRRHALALVRISAELRDDLAQLRLAHQAWLARAAEVRGGLEALGKRADDLAGRLPLPSPDETQAAVRQVAAGTLLEGVPEAKLVRIASWASAGAAASARLEFYPKGLPADRALLLSSGALSARAFTETQIRVLVGTRYPDAEPLPPRPALDALMAKFGLPWDPAANAYVRPNAPGETVASTTSYASRRGRTLAPRVERTMAERDVEELDVKLRDAVERRRFRILRVIKEPEEFAQALAARFDLETVSIEEGFVRHARQLMARYGVPEQTVWQTDRQGASGSEWRNLRDLMAQVQQAFLAEIVTKRGALVLTRPGLLARYRLASFFDELHQLVDRTDGLGALVVIPSSRSEAVMVIDGVPDSLPVTALDQVHRIDVEHTDWQRRYRPVAAVA
jgi:hypothetical protein